MRFRITTVFDQPGTILFPVDYRFALAAAVYRVMEQGDANYSRWLHDTGFTDGNKRFKLFTLSQFRFQRTILDKPLRALKVFGNEAEFTFSTIQLPLADTFIQGLFANQRLTLSQLGHKVHMVIKSVERLPDPVFKTAMTFAATTPIIVSYRDKTVHKYEQFLPPLDVRYANLLERNLLEKLNICQGSSGLNSTDNEATPFTFTLSGEPRKRSFDIVKGNGQRPITNIGYTYTFRLQASKQLMEIGYCTGFGEQNSFGGYVEIVE